MNIIADTNLLVRFLVQDDAQQYQRAHAVFEQAQHVIIPTHVFCELVWVLAAAYKLETKRIAPQIRAILHSATVIAKEDEIEAGLRMLEQGGDFADGINAYTGANMTRNAAVFASFDKQAVRLFNAQGIAAFVP